MSQLHPVTANLIALLRGANRDLSYTAIEDAAGRPLDQIRRYLRSARAILDRDEGIVFETVERQGLRRMTDVEKVHSTHAIRRTIHRTAGKGTQRLGTVSDLAALPKEEQLIHSINSTLFHAVREATGAKEGA